MLVTVCTPTYNRVRCLVNLFQSLKQQTSKNFEWIVVDDGSLDDTRQIVRQWSHEADFAVRYIYKDNGGKHTAVNAGVQDANGDCFIIVDSDDTLAVDAIETITEVFSSLPREGFAGAGFNKIFSDGALVGTTFLGESVDATALERPRYHITGDKAEVFWTDVIKCFPFPVFEGERFLTEAVVWNRIANAGYKLRWVNKGIYYCDYRADGLSMNVNSLDSFEGYTLYIKELLTYDQLVLKERIRWTGVYAFVAGQKDLSIRKTAERIGAFWGEVFVAKTLYQLKRMIKPTNRRIELNVKQ